MAESGPARAGVSEVPAAASAPPVLNIEDLTVAYRTGGGLSDAVRHVSLRIEPGQVYGLVGESGSGKSTLALAVMRYLSQDGLVRGGRIELEGRDLLALDEAQLRQVWGARVTFVPQDPLSSLNPSIRIGGQLAEMLRQHTALAPQEIRARTLELLRMVRLADPERVAESYPHQISGGMQQRVMIAMALSTEPCLLVLDEPTTGLDATTEAVVLDLFRDLIRERGTSTLYVSHNLGVVSRFSDRVAVLYAGELVEDAPTAELYTKPLHPYTQGLLDCLPRLGESKDEIRLRAIEGQIPPLSALPPACVFEPRCPLAIEICRQERPPLDCPAPGRRVRCHRWREILTGEVDPRQPIAETPPASMPGDESVLRMDGVRVHFPLTRTLAELLTGKPPRVVKAVNGVSLSVGAGRTLGLVGESGSGKTTLARAVIGLVGRREGEIALLDVQLPTRLTERSRETLRHLQMVFQSPHEALNPYLTIGESLRQPLVNLLGHRRARAEGEVARLLAAVRLPPAYASRYPGQLSGGEKQRVAIARAFAASPELLLCDEPVSALDVSVQASILNLLNALQARNGTAMVFISHDIAVVGYLADEVAVLYLGNLMEVASAQAIFAPPYHPYTEALLSSIPLIDPQATQEHVRLEGEVPSAVEVPSGCPFHSRCPRVLGEVCVQERPPWRVDEETGKRVFCHIPIEELRRDQRPAFVMGKRK